MKRTLLLLLAVILLVSFTTSVNAITKYSYDHCNGVNGVTPNADNFSSQKSGAGLVEYLTNQCYLYYTNANSKARLSLNGTVNQLDAKLLLDGVVNYTCQFIDRNDIAYWGITDGTDWVTVYTSTSATPAWQNCGYSNFTFDSSNNSVQLFLGNGLGTSPMIDISSLSKWYPAWWVDETGEVADDVGHKIDNIMYWSNIPTGTSPSNLNVTVLSPSTNISLALFQSWDGSIWINGTHNGTTGISCETNTTIFTVDSGANLAMGFNFTFKNQTAVPDGDYRFYVNCSTVDNVYNGTTNAIFSKDTVLPTITINPSNGFNSTNMSTVNQYKKSLPINITFGDDSSLFAYQINITNSSGFIFYNFTNTSVGGTTSTLNKILNASTWNKGIYYIDLSVSDSHTAKEIKDYQVDKFANKLTFNTNEENQIKVSSVGAYNTDYTKVKDRYNFEFDYLLTDTERTFMLESNNKIYYLPDSKYNGHFVVWNEKTQRGNWIDFEGIGKDYSVIKINDNKYNVIFTNLKEGKKVNVNSIGGLNIVEEHYSWYRGNYTVKSEPTVTSETKQVYTLNISKNNNYISDIDAAFMYDSSLKTVNKYDKTSYFILNSTFTVPDEENVFNFTWYINITQDDGDMYNFTIDGNQSVFLSTLNIFVYDEENNTLIESEDITVYLSLEQTTETTTGGDGTAVVGNLTLGEYYIQAEGANYPIRGLYYTVINQTFNLNIYLVKDAVGNDYIDYFVRDTSLSNIEDARVTFQKVYNGTYTTVAQFETDYAGQGQIFQDQQNEYRIIVAHNDYPLKTVSLLPLQTSYVITLEKTQQSLFDSVYEGISYSLYPTQRIINVTDDYTPIIIDIYSYDSSLEYFGVYLDKHNFTCIPTNCLHNITGSPAGGTAKVLILGNVSGTFDVHYFFKRSGFDIQYIHGSLYGFQIIEAFFGTNFALFTEALKDSTGGKVMLAVLAAFGTAALVALAAQFGIAGMALMVVVVMANIFFMLAGFIDLIVGGILIIVGLLIYVTMSRDE